MSKSIAALAGLGQSLWYDTLSRALLTSGELRRMVEVDGLSGVTSNPTIFEKAMIGTGDYDVSIRTLVAAGVRDPKTLYERMAIEDIRAAADLLAPTYQRTGRADGFVSLEVSPHLAHDAEGTIAEARRLFREVDRPNVMIKVPGTPEGMPAMERLLAGGVNVNMTLLFGLDAYHASTEAYLDGIEGLLAGGGDPRAVSGVASFFLSRIDAAIEHRLASRLAAMPEGDKRQALEGLGGRIAVANAKLAYLHLQAVTATERWQRLADRGARVQRLLWASTGPKNPRYPRTMYIDALVGPDTVNTVPEETYRAFLAEARPRSSVTEGLQQARKDLAALATAGISIDDVTEELLDKGIASFSQSFDKLLAALERKIESAVEQHQQAPMATPA